jgi:glycosyltransferase involved in cell wall biosynthesis
MSAAGRKGADEQMRILSLVEENRSSFSQYVNYHIALREAGIDSRVLCLRGENEPSFITELKLGHNRLLRKLSSEINDLVSLIGLSHFPDLKTSISLLKTLKKIEFDILHIFSARLFSSYMTFPILTKIKPTIFTVTSMWSFTGHCHYAFDCNRWKTGCGKCPYLNIAPPVRRDATHLEWKLKDWAYKHSRFTLIAPSNWLSEQMRQGMLKRFPVHHIPDGIDTKMFQPLDKKECRMELGIPSNKNVLMFASVNLENYRKGSDLLVKSLKDLPESFKNSTVLLCMGGGKEIFNTVGIQTLNLGYVSDIRSKAICYSAADLFLLPTRADVLALVSIESAACGTPIVSFRVGGMPDLVRHGITGYLADPENVEDFRNGIIELLNDENLRREMSQQCRALVEKEFNMELYVQRFVRLCGSLVQ